jgi:hypothetical protein
MEGVAQKRGRDEEAVERSFTAGSSERTAETPKDEIKSMYRGVQYDKKNNRWRSRLHTDKTRHVGYFATEEEAARAWDQAALRFTYDSETLQRLNFLDESFARFKEFVEEPGPLDRFLPELKGVEKKALDTEPPMVVYVASIVNNRSMETIGEFFSARDAAKAYDWKCIERFGWGSLTNFPLSNYEQECIIRGGCSGLDSSVMPLFPSGKRFADSRNALQQITGGNIPRVMMQPPAAAGIQGVPPNASALNSAANPVVSLPTGILDMDANALMSHFAQQQQQVQQRQQQVQQQQVQERQVQQRQVQQQQVQQRQVQQRQVQQQLGGNQLGQLAQVAEQLQGQGIDVPLLNTPAVALRSEPMTTVDTVAAAAGAANLTTAGSGANLNTTAGSANLAAPAAVPVQQPVPVTISSAVPSMSAMSPKTHEALAQVSLGTFEDVKLAQEAMDRAGPMIKGISRLTEAEHKKHIELVNRSQAKLQDKIKEKDGEFHVSLKILGKSFELGPYQTVQDARMAHDKYSMVLDGASAQTFNATINVLLPKEESESLLFALNKIRSGITPPPPEEPTTSAATGHLSVAAEIPRSSLVANAFTSTLRRVASHTSLLDDAADLNRQLEKIENSVGKVANFLETGSPFASRELNPPCPLPAFPGVPQAGLNTSTSQPPELK